MSFIHAIDLKDFYPCRNLIVSGYLWSPNYLAVIDQGIGQVHRTINEFSIEQLRREGPQSCGVTPRTARAIIKASLIRRGEKLYDGYGEEILLSEQEKQWILKASEVELRFEEIRRAQFSYRVSRLSCLWLAERTEAGKAHSRAMFGEDVFILDVRLGQTLNLSRADTTWFDFYWKELRDEYIGKYWSGAPCGDVSSWEYLLDGEIIADNEQQIEFIRNHGAMAL